VATKILVFDFELFIGGRRQKRKLTCGNAVSYPNRLWLYWFCMNTDAGISFTGLA
jgi:hypothetical protein